jgi:hypothetical protein
MPNKVENCNTILLCLFQARNWISNLIHMHFVVIFVVMFTYMFSYIADAYYALKYDNLIIKMSHFTSEVPKTGYPKSTKVTYIYYNEYIIHCVRPMCWLNVLSFIKCKYAELKKITMREKGSRYHYTNT